MGTCQICERSIKDKFGVIAHHGYHRKGGWQTQSCMGARELPYEKSRDLIPKAIASIKAYIDQTQAEIEEVKKGQIAVPSLSYFRPQKIEPTDPFYRMKQGEYIRKLESDIKYAERDLKRLQLRYDEWKPVIPAECSHKGPDGAWTVEEEDNRYDTDLGNYGCINYFCTQCEKDITEEVTSERNQIANELYDKQFKKEAEHG